jgi:hypothetical protein
VDESLIATDVKERENERKLPPKEYFWLNKWKVPFVLYSLRQVP